MIVLGLIYAYVVIDTNLSIMKKADPGNDVSSGQWVDCTNQVTVSGNNFLVTNVAITGQLFFRLKK
jgi:hypothetical protein